MQHIFSSQISLSFQWILKFLLVENDFGGSCTRAIILSFAKMSKSAKIFYLIETINRMPVWPCQEPSTNYFKIIISFVEENHFGTNMHACACLRYKSKSFNNYEFFKSRKNLADISRRGAMYFKRVVIEWWNVGYNVLDASLIKKRRKHLPFFFFMGNKELIELLPAKFMFVFIVFFYSVIVRNVVILSLEERFEGQHWRLSVLHFTHAHSSTQRWYSCSRSEWIKLKTQF